MTTPRPVREKFLVAFSFAGEQRDLVRSIAEAVEQRLGLGSVFFDEWYEHLIAGDDADLRLQEIYGQKTELVVACVSARYAGKSWTKAEHKAIRALQMSLYESTEKRDSYRILPLRVGEGDVPGIFENTIAPEVQNRPPGATAELIFNRLQLVRPDLQVRESPTASLKRNVFLAEVTPDLDVPTQPISRDCMKAFLEERGWTVLPASEYPAAEYQQRLDADLRECLAFVQLLGPYPWKRGGFDRLQHDAAVQAGIPRFRFRSSEIDLSTVDPAHREFLTASDVIACGFEDFKHSVEQKLKVLVQQRETTLGDASASETPPLVRVVIRSTNPDSHWEKVFQWLYEHEQILSEQLEDDDTFETRQAAEPCQGFLVVCDAAALADGPLSTREHLKQCRQIQCKEKDDSHRPPVALIYWPPPDPSWPKLLKTIPLKLHRIRGDVPTNLSDFIAEVRKVAR